MLIVAKIRTRISTVPVGQWGHPRMTLEELVENGGVHEMEAVDYLLDTHVCIFQHILGFKNDIGIYPLRGGTPADLLDEFGEVLR